MIKVAVFGYGHLGKWHCEKVLLSKHAELYAIFDHSLSRIQDAKMHYQQVIATSDLNDFIDEIDAAIIVTPTSTHYGYLKILLEKDKHVFCEKPMCTSLGEGRDLRYLLKESRKAIQIGHSERYHKAWHLRERYKDFFDCRNSIIRVNRLAPYVGRGKDVDVVQDLMIHDLDLLLFLFKEFPYKARCSGKRIMSSKWDVVTAEFFFASGRKAYVCANRIYPKAVRELEILTGEGMLLVDMLKNKIHLLKMDNDQLLEFEESYEKQDHLYLEQFDFYQAIMNQIDPPVTYQDGLKALELVDMVESALEKE